MIPNPPITSLNPLSRWLDNLRMIVNRQRIIKGSGYGIKEHTNGVELIISPGGGGGGEAVPVKRYRFKARGQDPRSGIAYASQHKADWIVCREWNGTTEGAETKVALPYQLRRSPWDGMAIAIEKEFPTATVNVTYTYRSNTYRTAASGSLTESQEVIPRYRLNDEIFVAEVENGTGASYPEVDPNDPTQFLRDETGAVILTAINIQDINADGRAWARV